MLFASLDFLIFFVIVLTGYWSLAERPRARWVLLIGASYFFYCASAKPAFGALPTPWYFVGLLVLTSLVSFFLAHYIERAPKGSGQRRLGLFIGLGLNLGLLGYFKYTGFMLELASDAAGWFNHPFAAPALHIALPIGISFYTFQNLSYVIDVWRGRLAPEPSLLHYLAFSSFFPHLVAGPIIRAADFLPQLRMRMRVGVDDVNFAMYRIMKGLAKKVILGDIVAGHLTDIVFSSPSQYSSLENLLALYAFTLQIYADFSGYSDIAIGVAGLLGIKLPENFDRPYQSHDVGEFWRRWHMTLSAWLRDYLFFPLGGSRGSPARTYMNLWLTLFAVGMWHGASWNFVIYSNLQAGAMIYSRFNRIESAKTQTVGAWKVLGVALFVGFVMLDFGLLVLRLDRSLAMGLALGAFLIATLNSLLPLDSKSWAWNGLHIFLTFHFTTLSRLFFRADSLDQAREMVKKLIDWDFLGTREGLFRVQVLDAWLENNQDAVGLLTTPLRGLAEYGILVLIVLGIGYHVLPTRWVEAPAERLVRELPAPALGVLLAASALLVSQLLAGPRANIYFAF
jgi:D-alanyl-lipoteichoic acid acyltransferase DltB (MBOAT superfamily)